MADSRTSNAIKNSSATLLYRGLHIVLQFVLRTVFIRYLGKEYTGVSGLFTDILSVLSLMELGMSTAMLYALYKPMAEGNGPRISALMQVYKRVYRMIGILVFAAGMLCVPFLQYIVKGVPNIKEDIRLIFIIYVATTASSYFLVYRAALLRADQKGRVISKVNIVVGLTESFLECVLIIVFKQFFAYLIVHFLSTIGKNVILSLIASKRYKNYLAFEASDAEKVDTKALFKDVLALGAYKVSGVAINSTDSIFISAFAGTVEVAVIGNFTLVVRSVRTVVGQIVDSTKPSIGNLAATSSKEKQETIFRNINFMAFWVSCFCATCLFNLMNPFVGHIWFDTTYQTTMPIIAAMTANFFIAVMVFPVESFRTANGLFVQGWARPLIMAVLNLVLDFFMGRQWGILGIFLATTISRLLTQVWYDPYLVYKNVFGKSVKEYYWEYAMQAGLTALSCAVAYYISEAIPFSNVYVNFICRMLISAIIPNAMIIALFRKREEFAYIKNMGTRLLRKVKGRR